MQTGTDRTRCCRDSGLQRQFIVAALGRDCNNFVLHIYASLGEQERKMISQRTKAGMAARDPACAARWREPMCMQFGRSIRISVLLR